MTMPWPVPTPPEPDELLSSWLVRAAFRQGCDPSVLTDDLWAKWRCWTRDVDCDLDQARLERLERRSGIAAERIRKTSLRSIAERVSGGVSKKKGILPWITTLGSRGSLRRGGLQFCSQCLAEDDRPYYRLRWRFAWHTGCERHRCALEDRCADCNRPLMAHRLSVRETTHLARCEYCGADLRRDSGDATGDPDALALQRTADQVLRDDVGTIANESVTAPDWFVAAKFFVVFVRRAASRERSALRQALLTLGVPLVERRRIDHGMETETLRTDVRTELIAAAWHLLSLDRDTFVEVLMDAGVTRQSFRGDWKAMTAPLEAICEALPDNPRTRRPPKHLDRPRTQREVNAMVARLERRLAMRTR